MTNERGWICPKCNTVYAPSKEICAACSHTLSWGSAPLRGYAGTVAFSSEGFGAAGFGTFYAGPKVKPVAEQAQTVVSGWRDKGYSVKPLIDAAVDSLIEDADEDED